MTQGVLPFKYEKEKNDTGMTAELLAEGLKKEVSQLDEKLFLEVFSRSQDLKFYGKSTNSSITSAASLFLMKKQADGL